MKAKRLFSFLLALMMVTTLLGGAVVPVSANEPTVPVVEISGIPLKPEIGETIKNGAGIVPEGAGYTVKYYWDRYDGVCYDDYGGEPWLDWSRINEEEVVEEGKDYQFSLVISLDDNWAGWEYYVAGEDLDVQIVVNGGEKIWESTLYSVNVDKDVDEEYSPPIYYAEIFHFSEEITRVDITGVQEAIPGEIASVDGIQVPENTSYSFFKADYYDRSDSSFEPITGETFLPGEYYHLEIFLFADVGYHFAEDCAVYINGVQSDEYGVYWDDFLLNVDAFYDTRLDIDTDTDTVELIDTVELSYNIEEPVVGEAPQDVVFELPEDANYQAWAWWYEICEDGYYTVHEFRGGRTYRCDIAVAANEGYEFSEDAEVIINGTVADSDAYFNGGSAIYFEEVFETEEPVEPNEISYVELSGIQAPVAGEPLDESVTVLTEGCTAELNWSVYDGEGDLPVTGTAEKGKEYLLEITLTANEGYILAPVIEAYVDGVWTYISNSDGATAQKWMAYDTFEVIENVEISSTDKAELGAAASADGASVPEGANYTVSAYWGVLDMESGVMPFTGEFADNTVYTYMLDVKPADGYKFADDVTVTYNGEPVQEAFCYGDSYGMEVIGQVFTGTMQRINKVEINAKFKAGMKASDAAVTVPENAGYEIAEYLWVDMETNEAVEGSFVEGKQYGLIAYVAPKDGYVIELGAQTVINGTDEYEYMESIYAYLYGYTEVIMDCEAGDTDNGPSTGNTDGNPSTGDDSQIVLPLILMVLSAIGLVSVLTTKPRKYRA